MLQSLFRFVLALLVSGLVACRPVATGTEYVLFFDQSASISPLQREAWVKSADAVLDELTFSDNISIFPVHDHTLAAAPLFVAEVPGRGVSLEDLARAKQKLLQIRAEAKTAVRAALLATVQSRSTELFEFIDKLASSRPGNSAARQAFLFSDMLHSNRLLDMERTPLSQTDLRALTGQLQQRYGWTAETLRGVVIHCVLNGIESGQRRPVNDRRVLKEFWETLFSELGAQLADFETYIS